MLLVTGKQHAGDFIDLLGDGRLRTRSGDEPLFDVDLTYKVQVEPGGIAQVVGMARDFAAGDRLVVCLGDNIFEYAAGRRDRARWDDGALVFVKRGARPGGVRRRRLRRGRRRRRHRREGRRRRHALRRSRRRTTRSSGCTAYPPDVFDIIDTLEPSSRGELEITDVNRECARRGQLAGRARRGLVARRRQALGRPRRRRPARSSETGVNK